MTKNSNQGGGGPALRHKPGDTQFLCKPALSLGPSQADSLYSNKVDTGVLEKHNLKEGLSEVVLGERQRKIWEKEEPQSRIWTCDGIAWPERTSSMVTSQALCLFFHSNVLCVPLSKYFSSMPVPTLLECNGAWNEKPAPRLTCTGPVCHQADLHGTCLSPGWLARDLFVTRLGSSERNVTTLTMHEAIIFVVAQFAESEMLTTCDFRTGKVLPLHELQVALSQVACVFRLSLKIDVYAFLSFRPHISHPSIL